MGNTCSCVHIAITGTTQDAITGIVCAYSKLGFERIKTPSPEGGKQVILSRRLLRVSRHVDQRHEGSPRRFRRNVLRMVTPHMWVCRYLMQQVDRAALDRVAQVTEINDAFKIAISEGQALDDLELALLPILPVESARITSNLSRG